jgi:hypothetical protein
MAEAMSAAAAVSETRFGSVVRGSCGSDGWPIRLAHDQRSRLRAGSVGHMIGPDYGAHVPGARLVCRIGCWRAALLERLGQVLRAMLAVAGERVGHS